MAVKPTIRIPIPATQITAPSNTEVRQIQVGVPEKSGSEHKISQKSSDSSSSILSGFVPTVDVLKFSPAIDGTSDSALRILEPSQKTINTTEASRIYTVFDQLMKQMKILMNLPLVLQFLTSEVVVTDLANKYDLIPRIERLIEMNLAFERDQEDYVLAEKIESHSRNIVRSFHNVAHLQKAVLTFLDSQTKQHSLISSLNSLQILLNEKLRTLPSEESNRKTYLAEVAERQRSNKTTVDNLEDQLAEATQIKNMELISLNEQLRKLKSDLYQSEQFTEEQIRRTRNETEKQMRSDSKNSEQRQAKLTLEIQNTTQKHAVAIIEHQEYEEKLRRKKSNIEKQIEEWVNKYDKEVGEFQQEIDHYNEELDDRRKKHKDLFEKFETLEVSYKAIMEERRIQNEKEEAERREIQQKTEAAEIIQAFFRSYKVRKAIKYKGKKGKGKGKKGK